LTVLFGCRAFEREAGKNQDPCRTGECSPHRDDGKARERAGSFLTRERRGLQRAGWRVGWSHLGSRSRGTVGSGRVATRNWISVERELNIQQERSSGGTGSEEIAVKWSGAVSRGQLRVHSITPLHTRCFALIRNGACIRQSCEGEPRRLLAPRYWSTCVGVRDAMSRKNRSIGPRNRRLEPGCQGNW